jgi:hypothetical protein
LLQIGLLSYNFSTTRIDASRSSQHVMADPDPTAHVEPDGTFSLHPLLYSSSGQPKMWNNAPRATAQISLDDDALEPDTGRESSIMNSDSTRSLEITTSAGNAVPAVDASTQETRSSGAQINSIQQAMLNFRPPKG